MDIETMDGLNVRRHCGCNFRTKLVGDGCHICNPKLAAELDAERRKLSEDAIRQIEEVACAIPGCRYMDPPDGGDTSIGEQVRRMAEHIKELENLLAEVSYETRQYSEGFGLLWDKVDSALWGVK